MRNDESEKIKMRCYTACLIDLNEYLSAFSGAKESGNIGETEIDFLLTACQMD